MRFSSLLPHNPVKNNQITPTGPALLEPAPDGQVYTAEVISQDLNSSWLSVSQLEFVGKGGISAVCSYRRIQSGLKHMKSETTQRARAPTQPLASVSDSVLIMLGKRYVLWDQAVPGGCLNHPLNKKGVRRVSTRAGQKARNFSAVAEENTCSIGMKHNTRHQFIALAFKLRNPLFP